MKSTVGLLMVALLSAAPSLAQERGQPAGAARAPAPPPGPTGLGRFVIGQPLAAVIGPLQAEWHTRVRAVSSWLDEEVTYGRPLILELKAPSHDALHQLLRRCPEVRVFVLPYYELPMPAGTPEQLVSGLYLVFHQGVLARIWCDDLPVVMQAFQSEAYGFGAGVRDTIASAEVVRCTDSASGQPRTVRQLTIATRTWQHGDVVAVGCQATRYYPGLRECFGRAQDYVLIKSCRLDAELLRCQSRVATEPWLSVSP
ncbi:hypothetical protein EJV47_21460 [Hymenobacter gummosus]|uniref:Uncharacterized protein n=1 Tax=Hymenobacter gummosus TaxID=1776032 RepID=A0A3S0J733_9BACT|nr:hypothetical protein [Hymenobacter gummosus]RTQ46523.1 hypothetical protein EJV47_21460 [Hymenobacter gummosus]